MKSFKRLALLFTLILALGALAACGSSEGENDTSGENNENTEGASEGISGEVAIDGSSTVFPIMERLTAEYRQDAPDVEPVLNSSGSGGGFKKFTVGETDFSNASRPIKDEEKQIAEENGVEYTELEVAKDGLSVVVSQENDFLENVSVEELKQIFLAESGATKWSDINSEWPDEEIVIFSPGHDSGTFDYFNEVILEDNEMKEGENVTLSEDDNTLVKGVQGNPNAIGYFGYAYYIENKDSLKVLGISEGEGEAVKPNADTVQSGEYTPLSRPLFTYVNNASLKDKPQVADFAKYVLNNAGAAAEEEGYVALPQEKLDEQLEEIKGIIGE
ncbi:phosphate-binding protein [Pontibacillus halophilus JSM 076056 = DSM 19796]|uniref:Phosphate-binding protein n=1 Tax=Pontibacillus halophilus JSM 076056 = DSM 19796 TaxID=1385510 RepID=A0A0A5I4U3_9BACI|nr:PstS family phosphate ABC transporter substrate-binding protein [Pontibacillus halophilus]KGX90852.1 phosphate-binding protein [Pontibacillus halophilus JSM 076056 = DSM 19796]